MSLVWKYFKISETDIRRVVCLLCFPHGELDPNAKMLSRGIASKSFSTKPLWNHLRSNHPFEFNFVANFKLPPTIKKFDNNNMRFMQPPLFYINPGNFICKSSIMNLHYIYIKFIFSSASEMTYMCFFQIFAKE